MTNQEAIWRLKEHFRVHDDGRPTPRLNEAVEMAIDALEKQESIRDGKWIHDNVPVCCLACPTCEGKHTCAYYLSECVEKQVSPGMEDKDELDITSD